MSATQKLPDAALLGAVADLIANEVKSRHAVVRGLVADIARGHEKIDDYGNVIKTELRAIEARLAASLKQGEPGPPGERGERGEAGPQGERGERGENGSAATPWRHRRAFEPTVADYLAGDVVAHDGGAYVATRDNPGSLTGGGWAQLTQRGKPGQRGERGEKGERGLPGPAGRGIVDMFVERGHLVVEFSDGEIKTFEFVTEQAAA